MTRIKTAVVGAGHLGKIHTRLLVSQPLSWLDSIVEPFFGWVWVTVTGSEVKARAIKVGYLQKLRHCVRG